MSPSKQSKQSKARKALADVAEKLAKLSQREQELMEEARVARRRLDEAHARFLEHVEEGAVLLDGSAGDDEERRLHGELTTADAAVKSPQWSARTEGFRRARLRLDAERQRLTAEHFDDLAAELVEEAKVLRDDTRSWLAGRTAFALADLAGRHAALTAAWLVLERDSGMSTHTRLDVGHEFAVEVVGDPLALCVPRVVIGGDPTISSEPAPALVAGGHGVFPLDD